MIVKFNVLLKSTMKESEDGEWWKSSKWCGREPGEGLPKYSNGKGSKMKMIGTEDKDSVCR